MASESFKEDLPRACGSFVEKLEERGLSRAACGGTWRLQARMSARQRRSCQKLQEDLPFAQRVPVRGPVCAYRGCQVYACVWEHANVCLLICICLCVCNCGHMCMYVHLCVLKCLLSCMDVCVCVCVCVCLGVLGGVAHTLLDYSQLAPKERKINQIAA
jgi:hypothetical protein